MHLALLFWGNKLFKYLCDFMEHSREPTSSFLEWHFTQNEAARQEGITNLLVTLRWIFDSLMRCLTVGHFYAIQ